MYSLGWGAREFIAAVMNMTPIYFCRKIEGKYSRTEQNP